jgi:hypothetical protein
MYERCIAKFRKCRIKWREGYKGKRRGRVMGKRRVGVGGKGG